MKKHIWWLALCAVALLLAAVVRRPILFHFFADTGCACGEYHDEVTGWIVLNPLRDRSPERRAALFLEALRNDKCVAGDSICTYALENHRVSDWRLESRVDHQGQVHLYYRFTKYGVTEPQYRLTGEGLLELARVEGAWKVTNYSSYF